MKYLLSVAFLMLVLANCQPEGEPSQATFAPPLQGVPSYDVYKRSPYLQGGEQGHVILWGGQALSADSLERAAVKIAQHEKLSHASFYASEAGYQANISSSYRARNPDAKGDILGFVSKGDFTKHVH